MTRNFGGARIRLLVMQALALIALIILLGVAQLINHPQDSLIVGLIESILEFAGLGISVTFPTWGLAASMVSGLLLGVLMIALSRKPALIVGLLIGLLVLAVGINFYLWDSGVSSRGTAFGISTDNTFMDAKADWKADELKGYHLFIVSGTGKGSHLEIVGNDAHTLTLEGSYKNGELPTEGQTRYVLVSPSGYKDLSSLVRVELSLLMGLPLAAGLFGLVRQSLKGVGGAALLILLLPLNLGGNTSDNIQYILAFVLTFLIFMELGYAHFRYARYARTMGDSSDFFGVILWFFGILLAVIFFTTFLTAAAISFHDLLGTLLPRRFTITIEYGTIYGQAISVLLFFLLLAMVQSILARKYLAKPVEKHVQEKEEDVQEREFAGSAGSQAIPVEVINAEEGIQVVEAAKP